MNELNNFIPPTFPNPLAEISAVLKEMKELQRETVEQMAALRCAMHALCETHPEPAEALACYLERMDGLADTLPQQRVAQYGPVMQQFRDTLAAAATRRNQQL